MEKGKGQMKTGKGITGQWANGHKYTFGQEGKVSQILFPILISQIENQVIGAHSVNTLRDPSSKMRSIETTPSLPFDLH